MIRYDVIGSEFVPRFWCDTCGQPISGAGLVHRIVVLDEGVIGARVFHSHHDTPCSGISDTIPELRGGKLVNEDLEVQVSKLATSLGASR
jgi:hypothetical protein